MKKAKKVDFNPLVSIIIPVYNGSNYVSEAIDSALAQTYKNIEVIIVNDGSTDNTERIVKSYGNKVRYFKKENGGVATAMNFGIKKARGEYISWLSHDDVYFSGKTEKQIEALLFKGNKDVVVYSDFCEIDGSGNLIRNVILPKNSSKYIRTFIAVECDMYLQGCSLLIPKKLFYLYGFFDSSKKCTQDYYMWFKLASNVKFIHVNKILVKSRMHNKQDSITYAETKRTESDILRSDCILHLSDREFYGYARGSEKYYWNLYYRYKGANYLITPSVLLNKMHSVFGKEIGVSVIVPVYNVEKYLDKCLESLVEQTLMSLEIIVVDDGSLDSSGKIADRYGRNYSSFIKIFHKSNGGLGSARNFGLNYTRGKYVGYVDSDDYVDNQMFEKLYTKILSEESEIAMCEFSAINDSTNELAWNYELPCDINYKKIDEVVKKSTLKIAPCAWNKLFRKKILKIVPFGLGFFEDIQATPIYFSYARKITVLREKLYYYRVNRKGSIMNTKRDDLRNLVFLDIWKELLCKINPTYKKEIIYAVYVHIVDIIYVFPTFIDEIMDFFNKNKGEFINNEYINTDIKKGLIKNIFEKKFIPKKIHYIWFGNGKMTDLHEKCIRSWKEYAPDYEICRWDESNCDVNENRYVREAYANKKWAFVADYFRFKILNKYGGFYVDTDVEFNRRIDEFRLNSVFFGFEKNDIVNVAFFGSLPGSNIIKKMLLSYKDDGFINADGSQALNFPIPSRVTKLLCENYKFYLNGQKQFLAEDIVIYPINIITVNVNDGKNVVEHHYEYSWGEKEPDIPYKYYVTREYFRQILGEDLNNRPEKKEQRLKSFLNNWRLKEKKVLDRMYVIPVVGHVLVRAYLRSKKILGIYYK